MIEGQCLSQKSLAILNVNKLDLLPFQANMFLCSANSFLNIIIYARDVFIHPKLLKWVKWVEWVKCVGLSGYKLLQLVTRDYMWLQVAAIGYKWL